MERTTICLEKPILEKIREKARKERQTLKDTLREVIVRGLTMPARVSVKKVQIPLLHLGKEKIDIASRASLYQLWDEKA